MDMEEHVQGIDIQYVQFICIYLYSVFINEYIYVYLHKDIHVVQYVNVCNIITIISYMLPSSTDLGSDSCMLSTMRLHLKGGGHMIFFETSLVGILGRGNKESSFRGSHFRLTRREKRRSLRGTCLCPYQYIRELSGSHPSHSIPSYPVLSTKKNMSMLR